MSLGNETSERINHFHSLTLAAFDERSRRLATALEIYTVIDALHNLKFFGCHKSTNRP